MSDNNITIANSNNYDTYYVLYEGNIVHMDLDTNQEIARYAITGATGNPLKAQVVGSKIVFTTDNDKLNVCDLDGTGLVKTNFTGSFTANTDIWGLKPIDYVASWDFPALTDKTGTYALTNINGIVNSDNIELNGTNAYLTTTGFQTLNDFTIELDLSRDFITIGRIILSTGYNDNNSLLLSVRGDNLKLETIFVDDFGVFHIATNQPVLPSVRHKLLIKRSGEDVSVFIDSVKSFTESLTDNPLSTGRLTIGWAVPRNNPNAYYDGKIYGCSVWDYALSDDEIEGKKPIVKYDPFLLKSEIESTLTSDHICLDGFTIDNYVYMCIQSLMDNNVKILKLNTTDDSYIITTLSVVYNTVSSFFKYSDNTNNYALISDSSGNWWEVNLATLTERSISPTEIAQTLNSKPNTGTLV